MEQIFGHYESEKESSQSIRLVLKEATGTCKVIERKDILENLVLEGGTIQFRVCFKDSDMERFKKEDYIHVGVVDPVSLSTQSNVE
jgi:hypothetical protein